MPLYVPDTEFHIAFATNTQAKAEVVSQLHRLAPLVSIQRLRFQAGQTPQTRLTILDTLGLQLLSLNFVGCTRVTDTDIEHVVIQCRNLKEINLSGCTLITDVGVAALLHGCVHLSVVLVVGCKQLTNAAITLRRRHLGLRAIFLCDCKLITTVKWLATYCPNLQSLHLTNCFRVTSVAVESVAQNCPALEEIVLANCGNVTSKAIRALSLGCQRISVLNLSMCVLVNNGAVLTLTQLTLLEELDLSYLSITDAPVIAVFQACPGLRLVDISSCFHLSNASVLSLSKNCPGLQTIQMGGNNNFTNEVVDALTIGCPALNWMDMSCCTSLTGAWEKLPSKLKYLNMNQCGFITDAIVEELLRCCSNLTSICLAGSEFKPSRLTDKGIQELAESCGGKLKYVDLTECQLLTDAALVSLMANCPNLTGATCSMNPHITMQMFNVLSETIKATNSRNP